MVVNRIVLRIEFGKSVSYDIALIVVLTAALMSAPVSGAQTPPISISRGVHISTDSPKVPFAETFLAINPRDPRNLIATSLAGINGSDHSVAYASRDGGRTWRRARASAEDNPIFTEFSGDAVVYFDSEGNAFLGTMLLKEIPVRFAVSRSTDGGFTWQYPSILQGGPYDRPYFAIDNTSGKFNGRLYVAGKISLTDMNGEWRDAIGLSLSTDGGRTFWFDRGITGDGTDCDKTDGPHGVSDPLITPEGKLVIPILCAEQGESNHSSTSQLWTMVSGDGGLTFSAAQRGPSYVLNTEPGFRWRKSLTGPRAAIDSSIGPHRGRIYLAYPDFVGNKYVVKVAHSDDLGKTWSNGIAVNDNTNEGDTSNAAIAVNKDGVVGVVFNDRRDDSKDECFNLYFTASLDGGETFLPNVKASEQAACPFALGNWAIISNTFLDPVKNQPVVSLSAFPMRFPNGGETQGLVAGPDGVFHSAWINGESGVMQLWAKDFVVNRPVAMQPAPATRQNLSGSIALESNEPTIDFEAGKICTKLRLINRSATTILGPFALVLDDKLFSSFQDIRVINADNGLTSKGAMWNFPVPGATASLQPQEKSAERMICWGFRGGIPAEPESLLIPHFLVLGQEQRAPLTLSVNKR